MKKYETTRVGHLNQLVLTDEQEMEFRRLFPKTTNKVLAQMFGASIKTIQRLGKRLSLTKDKGAIMHKVQPKIRKTCEESGYYDSIRGKERTQEVKDKLRERRKEYNPIQLFKEKHPRKYRAWKLKLSETKKNICRKEKRRKEIGLSQQTRLHILVYPYTQREQGYRRRAIEKNYILSTNLSEEGGERYVIFYDSKTERSPKFEQGCIKAGFRLLELK